MTDRALTQMASFSGKRREDIVNVIQEKKLNSAQLESFIRKKGGRPDVKAAKTVNSGRKNNSGHGFNNNKIVVGVSDCFPSSANVFLEDGTCKSMGDLVYGDVIMAETKGYQVWSPFIGFLHADRSCCQHYLRIVTEDGQSVCLTSHHRILVPGGDASAGQIQCGSTVLVSDAVKHLVVSKVKDISIVVRQGALCPLTEAGTVIVDGVACSCYTTVPHKIAHWAMWPLRKLQREVRVMDNGYHWLPFFFGRILLCLLLIIPSNLVRNIFGQHTGDALLERKQLFKEGLL